MPVINSPRGEQFLGPDQTEFFAQCGAKKILSAIAARYRKITRIVKRSVGPKRNQRGVFVIRVRSQIQNAAEDVQFLKSQLNFARVHCLRERRCCRGHGFNCAKQNRTGDDNAPNNPPLF